MSTLVDLRETRVNLIAQITSCQNETLIRFLGVALTACEHEIEVRTRPIKPKAILTLGMAKAQAKRLSDRYLTFWYVVKQADGGYAVMAHGDTDASLNVATYYCGEDWSAV